jgi:arginase
MIQVVGAPFDLCGRRLGTRLGPIAIRLGGLVEGLERLGRQVTDADALDHLDASVPTSKPEVFNRANDAYRAIRDRVAAAHEEGSIPVVLGGDHSVAIGSVAGALRTYGRDLGVLWIDAHVDINTPEVSPSGNLHGMPLAALTGLKSEAHGEYGNQWAKLDAIIGETKLDPNKLAWLGLRDVDRGEVENLSRVPGALPLTMQHVDEMGARGALRHALDHIAKSGAKAVWVSFDVDCLDPVFAPGTGTAVRGGFTYREGHHIAETLHASFAQGPLRLAGLDVVEVNPLADTNNETAVVAMEWILSFFGKTILHREDPGRTER